AANQTIVPAEVVVEQQIKGFRLAGAQGLDGALLNFRLQTAAAESPLDAAIAIKKSLRANFLRAGTFNVDDDSQRDGFAAPCSIGQGLEDNVFHVAIRAFQNARSLAPTRKCKPIKPQGKRARGHR